MALVGSSRPEPDGQELLTRRGPRDDESWRRGRNVLDQLLALDRLRRATERAFPLARAFLRPGFDDGA